MSDQELRHQYRAYQRDMSGPPPSFSAVLKRPAPRRKKINWMILATPVVALGAFAIAILVRPDGQGDPLPNAGEMQLAVTDQLLMAKADTAYQRTDLLLPQETLVPNSFSDSSDVFFTSTDLLLTP